MKNMFRILLAMMLILSLFVAVSCSGNPPDGGDDPAEDQAPGEGNLPKEDEEDPIAPTLDTPRDIAVDFWHLSWSAIEGAKKYKVTVKETEISTADTSILLFDYVSPAETVTIKIQAIGKSKKEFSNPAEIVYSAEPVTEGLDYRIVNDDRCIVRCPEHVMPKNGELVLPDTYNGVAVTSFYSARIDPIDSDSYNDSSPNNGNHDYHGAEYSRITKVRLPSNLNSLGTGVLYKSSIEEIYLPSSISGLSKYSFLECKNLSSITIPEGIASIYDFVFSGCENLETVNLPDSVRFIHSYAFQGCGLKSFKMPKNLEEIHGYAFLNCTELAEIDIDREVSVTINAFDNTAWYNNQPDGLICLFGDTLYGYKGQMPENYEMIIPQTVKYLLPAVFRGYESLGSVLIPGSIKEIPPGAFDNCINLKSLVLSEGIKTIGQFAFRGCGIESVVLPTTYSCPKLGNYYIGIFSGCTSLKSVTVPGNARIIPSGFTSQCTALETVILGEGIHTIGGGAFKGCEKLSTLKLPSTVTSFELDSIKDSGIRHLVYPKVKKKNTDMFFEPDYGGGIDLEYLVIQEGTGLLDYNRFYRIPSLDTFFFEGTKEEFEYIEISRTLSAQYTLYGTPEEILEQAALMDAWEEELTVYYYSEEKPTEPGNYWHYVDGVPTVWEV